MKQYPAALLLARADCKTDHPPVSVMVLHHICMSCTVNLLPHVISMGKYGIMGTRFKRSVGIVGTQDCFHMSVFCTALGKHEIISAKPFIQMRAFRVSASASPADHNTLCQALPCKRIDLALKDSCISLFIDTGRGKIYSSVIVEQ